MTRTRPAGRAASGRIAAVVVYAQRAREAFKDVPIVIGGIEASLRRIAHFDYWSEKVRRSRVARRQGRPARVRQRRAADLRDRASPRGRREDHRDQRPARHRVRAQVARLHRDRLHSYRYARAPEPAHRSVCDGAGDPQGERRGRRSGSGRAPPPRRRKCVVEVRARA